MSDMYYMRPVYEYSGLEEPPSDIKSALAFDKIRSEREQKTYFFVFSEGSWGEESINFGTGVASDDSSLYKNGWNEAVELCAKFCLESDKSEHSSDLAKKLMLFRKY